MKEEIKKCQNCKKEFSIEPEDFLFYQKIKVPPPTFCPDCRLQRRMAFFNTLKLYKRKCDLCGKEVVSRYSADKLYKIYCPPCWWSDKWEAMEYGRDYDFSKPFFQQFYELWREVPLLGLSLDLPSAVESPYTNNAGHLKQCYLIFEADFDERCLYGWYVVRSLDTAESSFVQSCERCYDLFHCYKNYQVFASTHTSFSNDSAFLWQCMSCQNCFGSANLRSKQYYFFNEPYTREEYFAKVKEFDLGSHKVVSELRNKFAELWSKYPHKFMHGTHNTDVSGDLIFNSKNTKSSYFVEDVENSKYCYDMGTGIRDCYDYSTGWERSELMYEVLTSGENCRNVKFSWDCWPANQDIEYSVKCASSQNLFGCVGLKKKSYCIFNKQYSKEEYFTLREKIVRHMAKMPYLDKAGRKYTYGEFFPPELSPFGYNETLTNDFFRLSKEEAVRRGFLWREPEAREIKTSIGAENLPDHIKQVQNSMLNEVIRCASCAKPYRIIQMELEFYRRMSLPLPRFCPECRYFERVKFRNPPRFYHRECQCAGVKSEQGRYANQIQHFHVNDHCPDEFDTSYAPERKEIVYCEACYQSEVI